MLPIISVCIPTYNHEKFIAQYVANRQKYGYSDEEKFEMMAAFGGEEVVDIFTGKTVQY
jgi:glycosyltransferase involved in cell wall biosynthesis